MCVYKSSIYIPIVQQCETWLATQVKRIQYSRNANRRAVSDGIVAAFLPREGERQISADKKKITNASRSVKSLLSRCHSMTTMTTCARFPFRFAAGAHEVISKCTDGRAHENVPAFTLRCSANTLNLLACTFAGSVAEN